MNIQTMANMILFSGNLCGNHNDCYRHSACTALALATKHFPGKVNLSYADVNSAELDDTYSAIHYHYRQARKWQRSAIIDNWTLLKKRRLERLERQELEMELA